MKKKLVEYEIKWVQNDYDLINFMQPFIEEWERIQLEESNYKEAKELIERIKNGHTS
jgi:hypothetical protein